MTVKTRWENALAVASSGIAATQLMGGRTAHYTFQLSFNITLLSTCNMTACSNRAELLRPVSTIVWDEAPLMIKHGFHTVDKTFQDLMKNGKPLDANELLPAGEFRQIYPVILHGSSSEVVKRCFKRSLLWKHFTVIHLKTNVRMTDKGTAMETKSFADFLLRVENYAARKKETAIRGYHKLGFLSTEDGDDRASALIDHVYDGLCDRYLEHGYFADRAILTALNPDLKLNDSAVDPIPGDRQSVSVDTVEDAQDSDTSTFPDEFLASLCILGVPPHKLNLKVGAPIILFRNINGESGLCNRTRLKECHTHDHKIEQKW
ncbi:Helitron helicase [Phytophthora megakarya]|uniref:ATP-dependent DNA helicase n=1 Tax=Phytophthora megakarya TaxID=4795 RepID=A0A225WGV2_9STRA|nr:Helitron helicase [Phytophthora megakarya]